MDEALQAVIEMNESAWERFKKSLDDLTPEEIDWRPLPQANSINLIVRHLRIEAHFQLMALERGEPMTVEVSASDQKLIDSTPLDFERNLKEFEELYARFLVALRNMSRAALQEQTLLAYKRFPPRKAPAHLLSFHQAMHLTEHWGQICMIRNLYRKTRGEPARFFPVNPFFPK